MSQVNHPAHYGGAQNPYEVIKVIHAWELGFDLGSAVKYIARAGKKPNNPELQDLEKAAWFLNSRIEQLRTEKLAPIVRPVEPQPLIPAEWIQDAKLRWHEERSVSNEVATLGVYVDTLGLVIASIRDGRCSIFEIIEGEIDRTHAERIVQAAKEQGFRRIRVSSTGLGKSFYETVLFFAGGVDVVPVTDQLLQEYLLDLRCSLDPSGDRAIAVDPLHQGLQDGLEIPRLTWDVRGHIRPETNREIFKRGEKAARLARLARAAALAAFPGLDLRHA